MNKLAVEHAFDFWENSLFFDRKYPQTNVYLFRSQKRVKNGKSKNYLNTLEQ